MTVNHDVVSSSLTGAAKKKDTMKIVSFLFVFVSAGHNIVLQRSCKHHLTVGQHHSACGHKTMLRQVANEVVLRTNDVDTVFKQTASNDVTATP